jgi:hypothetical protein
MLSSQGWAFGNRPSYIGTGKKFDSRWLRAPATNAPLDEKAALAGAGDTPTLSRVARYRRAQIGRRRGGRSRDLPPDGLVGITERGAALELDMRGC